MQQSEWKPVSECHAPPKAGSACGSPFTGVAEGTGTAPAAAGLVKDISSPSQTKLLGTTAAAAEALRVIRGAKRLKSQGTQQERMEVAR